MRPERLSTVVFYCLMEPAKREIIKTLVKKHHETKNEYGLAQSDGRWFTLDARHNHPWIGAYSSPVGACCQCYLDGPTRLARFSGITEE